MVCWSNRFPFDLKVVKIDAAVVVVAKIVAPVLVK